MDLDHDNHEEELDENGLPKQRDDEHPLFMGVDEEDLLGGAGDDEASEDDELDAFGLHVDEEEEPEF